jgi:hypothetical protein
VLGRFYFIPQTFLVNYFLSHLEAEEKREYAGKEKESTRADHHTTQNSIHRRFD